MGERFADLAVRLPVIHRRQVPFEPRIAVPPDFGQRSQEIRRLDAELERIFPTFEDYEELVEEAFSSNIHYSTRIEGNPLPLDEVRKLTRRSLRGQKPEVHPDEPRQEILNHLHVWFAPEMFRPPWSAELPRDIHRYLMHGVSTESRPGTYRSGADDAEFGVYSDRDQLTFRPCPSRHVVAEMDALLHWTNNTAPALDSVVAASVMFHRFESIHPFYDGNGRTGRTLFHAYLQHHGLKNAHLCLLERELTAEPEIYYRVLGWTDQEDRYVELIDLFTDAILKGYQAAERRFRNREMESTELSESQRRILIHARRLDDWFDLRAAAAWMDGLSDQSVRKRLSDLVLLEWLEEEGLTRAKRYRFRHPLRTLRAMVEKATSTPE